MSGSVRLLSVAILGSSLAGALSPVALSDEAVLQQKRGLVNDLQGCRVIGSAEERLACYDDVAKKNAPPTYEGKLGFKTEPFSLSRPHQIRFRSQGVIFVLYVFDADGEVIQNLHIGGGGEDTYLIEKPGTYSLQIDGSARWQIWIEPV